MKLHAKVNVISHELISSNDWDDYILGHEHGNVFHTSMYFYVFNKTPGFHPFAFFAVDSENRIRGMLSGYIQRISFGVLSPIAKRAVLLCSPIVDDPHCMTVLLRKLISFTRFRCVYLEIRNHYDLQDYVPVFSKCGFIYEEHLNILVDLNKDEDDLRRDLSKSRSREIKQALKEKLEFEELNKQQARELYPILEQIYSRAKLPLLPKEYFGNVYDLPASNYKILGVLSDGKVAGAVLVLCFKDTVYGHFGGSRDEYYRKRPNDLLFWSTILWAKNNGFMTFDWLGAGSPHKPYGVRDWKIQFGGSFVNFGRFKHYQSRSIYKLAEASFGLVRKYLGKK